MRKVPAGSPKASAIIPRVTEPVIPIKAVMSVIVAAVADEKGNAIDSPIPPELLTEYPEKPTYPVLIVLRMVTAFAGGAMKAAPATKAVASATLAMNLLIIRMIALFRERA